MPNSPQSVAEDDRWTSIFAAAGARSVVQAFRLFREKNVELILIKGWAASRAYPGRQMMRQLAIRFPPEPIYSTIDMEGSFDSRFRIHYQMRSLVKRSVRSGARLARVALRRGFGA